MKQIPLANPTSSSASLIPAKEEGCTPRIGSSGIFCQGSDVVQGRVGVVDVDVVGMNGGMRRRWRRRVESEAC